MKRFIRNVLIMLYAIVAILITICLLSYNDYKVTMFGKTSLIIIDNDELSPEYNKGDLVIVDGSKEIKEGDRIFFYNGQMAITLAQVTEVEVITEVERTYTMEGDRPISSSFSIGLAKDAIRIEKIGTVLSILESKWGFLILVVLPAILAFLYEIFEVISEFRGNKRKSRMETEK